MEKFCETKQQLIIKSFRDVRITLSVDGSEDNQLHIKGMDTEELAKLIRPEDCLKELPIPSAYQETYKHLPLEADDSYCLEYTW